MFFLSNKLFLKFADALNFGVCTRWQVERFYLFAIGTFLLVADSNVFIRWRFEVFLVGDWNVFTCRRLERLIVRRRLERSSRHWRLDRFYSVTIA